MKIKKVGAASYSDSAMHDGEKRQVAGKQSLHRAVGGDIVWLSGSQRPICITSHMSVVKKDKIKSLPKSPGVYEFRDKHGKILYIGKAASLKNRVGSYFHSRSHLEYFGDRPHIAPMISQIADIKIHQTDSVLEALVLESNLIKKHQPKYNIEGKDDKSFVQVVVTKENFPRILIDRIQNSKLIVQNDNVKSKDYLKIFGPYISKKQLEIALKLIRKIFPYHSAKHTSRNCCFEHQIGLCPGPYTGAISRKDYLKNIRRILMILEGKKKSLLKKLEKEMKEYAMNNEFEKAAEVRDQIFALRHIQDVALISDEGSASIRTKIEPSRIEAYDISNIGGDFAVGSMVVFFGNKPDKSQYRKFRIRTVRGIDDVGMMQEILRRRFQNDWPLPGLILVDGGKGHLGMAERLLEKLKLDIPVVAVAKGPTRKNLNIQYSISNKIPKSKIQELQNIFDNKALLTNIMSEAHRFAIEYHRKLRRKNWKEE